MDQAPTKVYRRQIRVSEHINRPAFQRIEPSCKHVQLDLLRSVGESDCAELGCLALHALLGLQLAEDGPHDAPEGDDRND